jgi:phenylacetic acid degradation operon negative regulatory protein
VSVVEEPDLDGSAAGEQPTFAAPGGARSPDHALARRITARDVAATYFGYHWRNRADIEVPGWFLVALLADFGIAAPNTRATLRRLEREGLIEARKSGRNLFFRASPQTRARAEIGIRRILNFGIDDQWSGVWTIVAFSIPEKQSHIRMGLRDSLRLEGFAPFYDGMWIAPGDAREVAVRKADVRGVEQLSAHLVDDSTFMLRGRSPIESWDLDGISLGYASLIDEAEELVRDFREGQLSPTSALERRVVLLARYRRLVPLDPGLPLELMPDGWLRRRAREAVAEAFDAVAGAAAFRIDQLLDGVEELWADRVRGAARLSLDDLAAIRHSDA